MESAIRKNAGVRPPGTPLITAAADAARRPAPKVVVNLPIAVTDDPDSARSWIAEHFGASRRVPRYRAPFGREGVGGAEDVVVVGDERHVDKELRRFADAGATEFIAVPFGSEEQITRTLTVLGDLNEHG